MYSNTEEKEWMVVNGKLKNINKKFCLSLLINVVLMMPLLIYGGHNFSIDSYCIVLNQQVHIDAFLGSYRWFGALVYKIYIALTGHNPILNSTIDIIIFIALVVLTSTFLIHCIVGFIGKKDLATYIAIDLSVLVSIANVWFCNILSFPECVFITAIGISMCFGAVISFIKLNGWLRYLISGVLLICATGVYQQFISIFTIYLVAICAIELFAQNKTNLKQIVLHYIKPISLIVVSGVIYFSVGKVAQIVFNIKPNSRVNLNFSGIVDNILYFIKSQHSFLKGRGFFDTEFLTLCFLITGLIWFICVVKDWLKNKNTARTLFLMASYAAAYASAYLPGILSTSHAARAMVALFSVFSLFTILIVFLSEKQTFKILICTILSVVFIVNMVTALKIEMVQKEQNEVDKVWSETVIGAIDNYEKENNVKIKTIKYCYDRDSDLSIEKSESAVMYDYSLVAMINYFSERNFEVIEISDEKQRELFADKEWDTFTEEEQLVFDDDILYLCCY